jgi:nucleoside-diphosphate-sugar epimerase
MKRILVTGSSGFIGDALNRHLVDLQYEVFNFDSNYSLGIPHHRRGSILNPSDIEHAVEGIDIVFHLAGLLGTSELLSRTIEAIDVNIKGTINLLEACQRQEVQTIFYPAIPTVWLNTYSITKKASADFARMFAQMYGLDIRILRWLNAYGPGQKLYPVRKAVPMMILQGLHNLDIEVWGSGEQPIFLIFVEDLVRITALYTLDKKGNSDVRDTGNTVKMNVNELADLIRKLTGSSAKIKHLPMRAGEDPTKPVTLLPGPTATEILGLSESTTSIVDGLGATIEYYAKLPTQQHESALAFYYGRSKIGTSIDFRSGN